MLQKFEALPHEKAQTNLMMVNALAATIENNIECVYDFIVAEDVHLAFLKGKPEMLGYDIEVGPWNRMGATRITRFEGNVKFRETVIGCERPYYFQYMVTEFDGGWFEGLIDLAVSTFTFSSHGPRTRVNWQYQMRPVNMDKLVDLQGFMREVWYPWQQSFFTAIQGSLNKDPWSV